MIDEQTSECIAKLTADHERIAALKAHPVEDCYTPILQRVQEFIANPEQHTWENFCAIADDPLYKAARKTDYMTFNKDFVKFSRIGSTLLRAHFEPELKRR